MLDMEAQVTILGNKQKEHYWHIYIARERQSHVSPHTSVFFINTTSIESYTQYEMNQMAVML